MERALSRACLLSRARLTGVLVERQLRGLLETMSLYQILFTLLFIFQSLERKDCVTSQKNVCVGG